MITKNRYVLEAVQKFRRAAIRDGWEATPVFKHEDIRTATSLTREGFKIGIIARENHCPNGHDASINIWGPDGLVIKVPAEYDFEKIKAGMKYCYVCKRDGVETRRVGFAGRVCNDCYPAEVKRVEVPGWCD